MANHAISTPNITPGHRLVPARIGSLNRSSLTVWIECPFWCTVDHVDEPERHAEDIAHQGDDFGTVVPSMTDGHSGLELYARIYADPASSDPRKRAAHLLVGNGTGPDVQMTPAEGLKWVDELISFAARVRNTIRVCETANGDPGPDTDEALRRVREGGAA